MKKYDKIFVSYLMVVVLLVAFQIHNVYNIKKLEKEVSILKKPSILVACEESKKAAEHLEKHPRDNPSYSLCEIDVMNEMCPCGRLRNILEVE